MRQGYPGKPGASGGVGVPGPQGLPGADGIGPPKPRAVLSAGAFPAGQCYGATADCAALGVKDNLCGRCEPLCKQCGASAGFRLINGYGLRFGPASFDAAAAGAGSVAARNLCALARYGNGGRPQPAAADTSFAKAAADGAVPSQPRWFGACKAGDAAAATCCVNARPVAAGFDWNSFAVGDACAGGGAAGPVAAQLDCVFDKEAYAAGLAPAARLVAPAALHSDAAEAAGSSLQSANGMCRATLEATGELAVYMKGSGGGFGPGPGGGKEQWAARGLAGAGAPYGPYALGMAGDGGWAVRNKDGVAVWTSGTANPAGSDRLEMGEDCRLCVVGPDGARRKCSCGAAGGFAAGACLG